MPVCFPFGNTWSGWKKSPDVQQRSGEETEWPLSFLWGTMDGNKSARWIGVRHQQMIGKVLLPLDRRTHCCEPTGFPCRLLLLCCLLIVNQKRFFSPLSDASVPNQTDFMMPTAVGIIKLKENYKLKSNFPPFAPIEACENSTYNWESS